MNKVYYNQADPRWASHPYPAPSYPNGTVKSSGCGITCGAMIVSSSKEIVYPDYMADLSRENGYRVDGGTADGFFSFICKKWGLEIETIHSSYEAFDKCKNGYFVVMCVANGLWTTGGHFILAVGTRGDEIQIFDPYLYNGKFNILGRQQAGVKVEGTSCFVQIDKFKEYSNVQRLYAIKVSDTDNNTVADDPVKVETAEIRYVSTSAGLNVRSGRGTNYSVVTTLPLNTQVLVYDIDNGWARIGNNQYVSAQYLSTQRTVINTQVTKYVKVNSVLNVRSGPNTNYKVVGTLNNGTKVTVSDTSNGFSKIGENRWVSSQYLIDAPVSQIRNTVGQTKIFARNTTLYSNANLTGTKYNYLPNTKVKILSNINSSVDRVYVVKTGRVAYCKNNVYR